MQGPQLELWSAEPHPAPSIYQALTPQQRSRLINDLAQLILKLAQDLPLNPPPSSPIQSHE